MQREVRRCVGIDTDKVGDRFSGVTRLLVRWWSLSDLRCVTVTALRKASGHDVARPSSVTFSVGIVLRKFPMGIVVNSDETV
jgi:hypothetical protein